MTEELATLLEETESMLLTLYCIPSNTALPYLDTLRRLEDILQETKELLTGQLAVIDKQKQEKWIGQA